VQETPNGAETQPSNQPNGNPTSLGDKFRLKIWSNRELHVKSTREFKADITPDFLAKHVPGFIPVAKGIIGINYDNPGVTVYAKYSGGKFWKPMYPSSLPRPMGFATGSLKALNVTDFLEGLVPISIVNSFGLRWMPLSTKIMKCSLRDEELGLKLFQSPKVEETTEFNICAISSGRLQINTAGVYIEFRISDIFDRSRVLRLYHKGYDEARLALKGSIGFERVVSASYDGVKLRIIAAAGREFSAATLYKTDPASLYDVDESPSGANDFLVRGAARAFCIERIGVRRKIERATLLSMSTYAHGRIGAEIAYAISSKKLGLTNVILREPSTGGKDLHTKDGRFVIQARLLTNPRPLRLHLHRTLRLQLSRLVRKLRQDFEYNSKMAFGYAILSYLNPNDNLVKSIVLEVPKQ